MRSTRATELADVFPAHVINVWLARAVAPAEKAAQNPAQQMDAESRKPSRPVRETAKCGPKPRPATCCDSKVGAAGFEPATKGL